MLTTTTTWVIIGISLFAAISIIFTKTKRKN